MDASGIRTVVEKCRRTIRLLRTLSGNRGRSLQPRATDTNGGVCAMKISVPDLSLVVLVGASGCGKSMFARRHFKPTEVLSSDFCRGLVADNENDQSATPDAFDILDYIARKRLAAARLTVIDATNVKAEDRKSLIELARAHHVLAVAIVFDLPPGVCQERNRSRADR